MQVTVFQSTKTTGKIPYSPSGDKKFKFETYKVETIKDVFFHLASNFMLNIPLIRGTTNYRRRENLEHLFVQKLDYIIVDIDEISKMSDRNLWVNFFKQQNYKCILAESRNPLNIKGVLVVNNLTPKETKQALKILKEQANLPGKVDFSVTHYASYQAPILKSVILYEGGTKYLEKVEIEQVPYTPDIVPNDIQDICKNLFMQRGYQFHESKNGSICCSHFTEKKTPKGFTWNPNNPFKMFHWNPDRTDDIWSEAIKTKEYKIFQKIKAKEQIQEIMPKNTSNINKRFLDSEKRTVQKFFESYKILKIQSPMGTAKSTVIDEVLKQSNQRGLRVLLITNRISLADDISKKYKNIKHYQNSALEDKYQIGDNLVCQVNSLWKYSLKYFDTVIIDEVTSLLFQLLSLEKNVKNIIQKIFAVKNKSSPSGCFSIR